MRMGAKERFDARYAEIMLERRMAEESAVTPEEKRIADQVVADAGAFSFGAAGLFAGAVAAVRIIEAEKLAQT